MLNERSPLLLFLAPRETASGSADVEQEYGVSSRNVAMRPVRRRMLSSNIALLISAAFLLAVLVYHPSKVLMNDNNNGIAVENIVEVVGKYKQFLLGHMKQQQTTQQTQTQTQTQSYHFAPVKRCSWVKDRFNEKDADKTPQELATTYAVQGVDANVFYRATAHLFWQDFRDNQWDTVLLPMLKDYITDSKGRNGNGMIPLSALTPKSTWTWVTGDQHLSNFGAWRNRHGDIVFGVNDFDEAAIFDFQVDVLRIAVSVCGHADTVGLSPENVLKAIHTLTDSYVETVLGYIGNDKASLFELTPDTTHGKLRDFLVRVRDRDSAKKQLERFTQVNSSTGQRSLIKGPIDEPDIDTGLQAIPPFYEEQIRNQFTATKYGATLMQVGWNVNPWDDTFFTILDAARRVGVGIGSYGVRRGFVLLKGTDGLLVSGGGGGDNDGTAVILDVKYQPNGAVSYVLTQVERAWYEVMFNNNSAKRVTAGQLHLTSYTDPFIGWLMFEDRHNHTTANHTISNEPRMLSMSVRQRSPWKATFDIDGELTDPKDFLDFVQQIAVSTATSHVRGTVAKPPGDFKHVIATLFGSKKQNRRVWGDAVAELAIAYHEQVLLDFECFQEVFMNHSATDIY